jgi:hypothetical protein
MRDSLCQLPKTPSGISSAGIKRLINPVLSLGGVQPSALIMPICDNKTKTKIRALTGISFLL